MRGIFAFVLGMIALGTLPCGAEAQTAVLFPVGGDAALASAHADEVLGQVTQALEDAAFTVVAGDALAAATSAAHAEPCADPSCAGPMLTSLSADIAVGVALWHRHGVVQVSVVLVDPHGVQVSADADGAESVIGQLVQAALAQARARWATRGGSPVRVIGGPDGATITVDHEPWGTIPHEASLSPGAHHVVVSADGFVTERRDVDVAVGSDVQELSFVLVAATPTGEAASPPSGGPDVGLIVAGSAVAVVGAGALIAGIVVGSGSETCVRGCTGPAVDRVVAVPATELGIGLAVGGGVLLAAGVVLAVVGATSGGSSSGSGSSSVALTRDGLVVRF